MFIQAAFHYEGTLKPNKNNHNVLRMSTYCLSFPPLGYHYNAEHILNLKDTFGYCEGIFHSYGSTNKQYSLIYSK
jgi:hypothetical protein